MAAHPHHACALPEGLRYYLLRNNHLGGSVMVPVVPVDQLSFQLQGVPRQLTHRQISDGGWKLFSETNQAPSAISIQAPTTSFSSHTSPAAKLRFFAPDHQVRTEPQGMQAKHKQAGQWLHPSSAPENAAGFPRYTPMATPAPMNNPERPLSLTDTFASIYQKDAQRLGYRTPYPSGIEPDPSKKEFCTHWIKTGECAFTSVGCKYKHEMPPVERLRELGFTQGLPKWWKEKSAITARAPTWMQRRLAGNEDGERSSEMPAPRVFPDPSTFRARQPEQRDLLDDGAQHTRGILRRENASEQSTRPTAPPAPVQAPVRCASQMSTLLTGLDDMPAPPPSPQLSNSSTASAASAETQVPSSRNSASPPSSPVIEPVIEPVVECKIISNVADEKELSIHRHSQISWGSESEEDSKPLKLTQRRKRTSRGRAGRHPATVPSKQHQQQGLANLKYAPPNTNNTETRSRNAETHGRNANRRLPPPKANQVGAPELHAKIEQLHCDAHQKDRASKATNGEAQGRGDPAAVVLPGKQTAV